MGGRVPIATEKECEAAAVELGLSKTRVLLVTGTVYSTRPHGCYWNGALWFNPGSGSKYADNGTRLSICKAQFTCSAGSTKQTVTVGSSGCSGGTCPNNRLVKPVAGVQSCASTRLKEDNYADTFSATVASYPLSQVVFKRTDSSGGWGLNLKWECCLTTPTPSPSKAPTKYPSGAPTASPTRSPSKGPTFSPTKSPTPTAPTFRPTRYPTAGPSASPSSVPSSAPTQLPSASPTFAPTGTPSASPSFRPTTAAPTPLATAGSDGLFSTIDNATAPAIYQALYSSPNALLGSLRTCVSGASGNLNEMKCVTGALATAMSKEISFGVDTAKLSDAILRHDGPGNSAMFSCLKDAIGGRRLRNYPGSNRRRLRVDALTPITADEVLAAVLADSVFQSDARSCAMKVWSARSCLTTALVAAVKRAVKDIAEEKLKAAIGRTLTTATVKAMATCYSQGGSSSSCMGDSTKAALYDYASQSTPTPISFPTSYPTGYPTSTTKAVATDAPTKSPTVLKTYYSAHEGWDCASRSNLDARGNYATSCGHWKDSKTGSIETLKDESSGKKHGEEITTSDGTVLWWFNRFTTEQAIRAACDANSNCDGYTMKEVPAHWVNPSDPQEVVQLQGGRKGTFPGQTLHLTGGGKVTWVPSYTEPWCLKSSFNPVRRSDPMYTCYHKSFTAPPTPAPTASPASGLDCYRRAGEAGLLHYAASPTAAPTAGGPTAAPTAMATLGADGKYATLDAATAVVMFNPTLLLSKDPTLYPELKKCDSVIAGVLLPEEARKCFAKPIASAIASMVSEPIDEARLAEMIADQMTDRQASCGRTKMPAFASQTDKESTMECFREPTQAALDQYVAPEDSEWWEDLLSDSGSLAAPVGAGAALLCCCRGCWCSRGVQSRLGDSPIRVGDLVVIKDAAWQTTLEQILRTRAAWEQDRSHKSGKPFWRNTETHEKVKEEGWTPPETKIYMVKSFSNLSSCCPPCGNTPLDKWKVELYGPYETVEDAEQARAAYDQKDTDCDNCCLVCADDDPMNDSKTKTFDVHKDPTRSGDATLYNLDELVKLCSGLQRGDGVVDGSITEEDRDLLSKAGLLSSTFEARKRSSVTNPMMMDRGARPHIRRDSSGSVGKKIGKLARQLSSNMPSPLKKRASLSAHEDASVFVNYDAQSTDNLDHVAGDANTSPVQSNPMVPTLTKQSSVSEV